MSVKKEPSGRRSVQVEVEVPGSTQSAVARRSAEAQLRALIAKFAPAHLRLIGAMRRWLRKRLPTAHEVVYEYHDFFVISYSPNERGYEGVLAIRASANGVRLYFNRGKELPDPAKLLQGSGNQTRSINLEGASTLARPEVARLIDEAIARNRVPFARAGRARFASEVGSADDVDAGEGKQQHVGSLHQAAGDLAFQGLDFLGFVLAIIVQGERNTQVLAGGNVARRGLLGPVEDSLDGALLEADTGLAE
jgi:hypothetical protein